MKPIRIKLGRMLDVLVVSEGEHIRWLNAHPDVVRPPPAARTLLHRIVHRRLHGDLHFEEGVLPVFQARDDEAREREQKTLVERLRALQGTNGEEAKALGRFLIGDLPAQEVGPIVQQFCGRLFSERYRSDPETYAAGRLLAGWPSAPPWRTIRARLSGQLERAKQRVATAAGQDPQAIHGTSIAMENVARSVRNLRRQAMRRGGLDRSADAAVRQALVVPPVLIRGCARSLSAPFVDEPLQEQTLIVLLLARAYENADRDLELGFLRGEWSACPAHHVVPEVLMNVWEQARSQQKAKAGGFGKLLRLLAA